MLELNRLYNMDCMDGMAQFPDGYFELAIVDPPYGTIKDGKSGGGNRFGGRFERYGSKQNAWDFAPDGAYFDELFRVSKKCVIWGGNYFNLNPTQCFLIWRKLTITEKHSFAMCEYAWTNINGNAKLFEFAPQSTPEEKRFHPTQKPVPLYKWILKLFSKDGDKILDTHAWSASSLVACHEYGFDFIGFEIDPDYYQMANERLQAHMAQMRMC